MAVLTDKTELTENPADGDFVHVVDVSDTTGSAAGTSKKVQATNAMPIKRTGTTLAPRTAGDDLDMGTGNVDANSFLIGGTNINAVSETLTNKTIDGDDNTVQDLALTTLKTDVGNANKVLHRNASGVVVDSPVEIDASGNVDIKDKGLLNTDYVDFNLTPVGTSQEGRLLWDADAGTVAIGMPGGNVTLQTGQEVHLPRKVKNDSGVDIKNGNLVYISGGTGVNAEVTLAIANDITKADKTLAMATEDIDDGNFGFCTAFGLVKGEAAQPIDTSAAVAGTKLYLSPSVSGGFTTTMPSAPNRVVCIGTIFRQHASEGIPFVNIDVDKQQMSRDVSKEPTGFTAPGDVIVTGDNTARTVTLTGTVNAYYRGVPVSTLTSGWVSDAHPNDTNAYFLTYNGTSFNWISPSSLDFSHILIALTWYAAGDNERVYQRECHGLMPWQTHRAEHRTIGLYRQSGGTLADYTLSSTTAADRRPSVSSPVVWDEDLPTTIPLLAANGPYTQFTLSSTETSNLTSGASDIVPLNVSQPYWNELSGGTWGQTLMSNNYFSSIWLVAVPMAADADSQKYRFLWVQGQNESLSASAQLGLDPNSVSLGDLNDLLPELVFVSQVIIKYQGGDWIIQEVVDITGTRFSQTSSPSGTFLSNVTSDATLTGDGTTGDPLGVNLETNTANIKMNGAVSVGALDTLARADHIHASDTSREPTLTKGDLTEATSSVLTISSGTGAVIGAGTTIEVDQADTDNDGYLSSTDWDTFNDKQADVITTRGDIIRGSSGNAAERLALGAANYVLTSDGTDVAWAAAGAASGVGLELVGTTTISNDSEIVFTGLDDGYHHLFILKEVIPVTNSVTLYIQISRDGGSSYISASYAEGFQSYRSDNAGNSSFNGSASQARMNDGNNGYKLGTASGEQYSGELLLVNPSNATIYKTTKLISYYIGDETDFVRNSGGHTFKDSTGDYDAIRFYASSGNLNTGEIEHYRYKG